MTSRYWVVTDLETSGLDESRHEIIQIARVVVDTVNRCIVPGMDTVNYVRPSNWVSRSRESDLIHKISLDTLSSEGVHIGEALGNWSRGIDWSQSVLAAWGADFEQKFLSRAYKLSGRILPYSYKTIDVRSQFQLEQARNRIVEYEGLETACHLYGLEFNSLLAHDALYDTMKTAELAIELLNV